MRFTLAILVLAAAPLAAQQTDPLAFLRPPLSPSEQAKRYSEIPYRPVRPGEVRSAGFLTENRAMPFGRVLGPVSPEQVQSSQSAEIAMSGMRIAVRPPAGVAYQRGDTILLAIITPGPEGWGDIVIPTGLARVGDHDPRQTIANVIATYGPIRDGQVTLPLEPVPNLVPSNRSKWRGRREQCLVLETRELQQPGGLMFIDIGRTAGIRIGDFVEIRRRPGPRLNASDTIDELIATAQVVHVGDKSSTILLNRVVAANIDAGTPVVRVGTLPN